MAEKEFKKVALQDVSGDYIAPVAYSAKYSNNGVDLDNITDNCVNKDLSNLSSIGEAHFVKPDVAVTHSANTQVGTSSDPVYVGSNGIAYACGFSWSNIYAITSYLLQPNNNTTYFQLNNGLKVELGTFSASASTGSVSLHYTYTSNSSFKVFLQQTSSKSSNCYTPHIVSQTRTSFNYYCGSYSNIDTGVYYMVIGY